MPKSIYYDGERIIGGEFGGDTNFTTDDTLTLQDGVLGVTTPVHRVLTPDEFEALPEKEKNNGLYIIQSMTDPDSLFPFGTADIYSTDEVRIGTWIDGKPLYRKVFQVTTPSSDNSEYKLGTIDSSANIVNIYGVINTSSGYTAPMHCTTSGSSGFYFGVVKGMLYINLKSSAPSWYNRPCIVVIEYTKPTDEPDNATQALVSDLKIEEYDTTVDGCDWHVRKWSNGYCEFYGRAKYPTFECATAWGALFNGSWSRGPLYPFDLKFVYKSDAYLERSSNIGMLYTTYAATDANDMSNGSPSFNFFRVDPNTLSNLVIVFHAVGRWK